MVRSRCCTLPCHCCWCRFDMSMKWRHLIYLPGTLVNGKQCFLKTLTNLRLVELISLSLFLVPFLLSGYDAMFACFILYYVNSYLRTEIEFYAALLKPENSCIRCQKIKSQLYYRNKYQKKLPSSFYLLILNKYLDLYVGRYIFLIILYSKITVMQNRLFNLTSKIIIKYI